MLQKKNKPWPSRGCSTLTADEKCVSVCKSEITATKTETLTKGCITHSHSLRWTFKLTVFLRFRRLLLSNIEPSPFQTPPFLSPSYLYIVHESQRALSRFQQTSQPLREPVCKVSLWLKVYLKQTGDGIRRFVTQIGNDGYSLNPKASQGNFASRLCVIVNLPTFGPEDAFKRKNSIDLCRDLFKLHRR